MKKRFIITQDFASPYMRITGRADRPHKIEYKRFKKGQTIEGKVHFRNGKPAWVMIDETLVIPLTVIKEVKLQPVALSSAEGEPNTNTKIAVNTSKISKQKYVIAALVGIIGGFGVNYYIEKKGWVQPDPHNKFVAMSIGGALTAYILYLCSPSQKIKDTEIKKNITI